MYNFSQLPTPVQQAARFLHESGESAWLVGGATRDILLGRSVKDFDFVIAGDGLHWARCIARELKGAFVALDEERLVGRVVIKHEGKPLWIDVARFRGASDQGDGVSLEEDLSLRDFTVNAIALEPLTGSVVDPTGGGADLGSATLRATGPRAFQDDPLRILRGIRLHATHHLIIETATWEAMRSSAPALSGIAAERVREEWLQLLAPSGAMARIALLDDLKVLDVLLPELVQGKGVTQSSPHSHDVFGHNLLVLDAIEGLWPWVESGGFWQGELARFVEPMTTHLQEPLAHELPRWLLLKHVALLHDVAKPTTRTVGKDGRIHFYGHDQVGAKMMGEIMRRMKFSTACVQYAEQVLFHHLRPLGLSQHLPPSDRSVYRFYRDVSHDGPDIALHSMADQRGKAFATDRVEVVAVVTRLLEAYFEAPERFVRPVPLLDGNDVMALTNLRGPAVGIMLERLREAQAQQRIRTRAEAERFVQREKGNLQAGTSSKRGERGEASSRRRKF
ncbi:MAG: HDIG domain-containing protein [Ardenticatenales bacterium]|nr:HDIG domain-containing protein [Ardenticatenales bacterium]